MLFRRRRAASTPAQTSAGESASAPAHTAPSSAPAATPSAAPEPQGEVAIFAAGCFWGVQRTLAALEGVLSTEVGYIGGELERPSYEEICNGDTGHAEAVRLVFDPEKTSYRNLLQAFFGLHDPTQLNRQGPDHGSQYRSAIFCQTPLQREQAEGMIALEDASARNKRPVVTEVSDTAPWWRAEEYHQHYLEKRHRGRAGVL